VREAQKAQLDILKYYVDNESVSIA